jgi:ABC-2 type transport system ATP-binding protein
LVSIGLLGLGDIKVALVDEPFKGLDDEYKDLVKDFLRDLVRKDRIIVTTCNCLEEAEAITDCYFLLNNGEIVLEGSLNRLKSLYNCSESLVVYHDPCSSKHNLSKVEKLIETHFKDKKSFSKKNIRLNH